MSEEKDQTVRIGGERGNTDVIRLVCPDGRIVEISNGDVVGRNAAGKEVFEKQEEISRRHAQFFKKEGRWFIVDLNSSNGTFLEGKKIQPKEMVPIGNGETLKFSPAFQVVADIPDTEEGKTACIPLGADGRRTMVVLFADLKGSVDFFQEKGTIVARNWIVNLYRMLSSIISAHKGKHLKNIGDAILAVFDDPCEAARAAVEMQGDLKKHNDGAGEADRYYLRIGMNIGNVLFENNDVFGNAVNIASRVQAIAPPERIFITSQLFSLIKDEEGMQFGFIGDKQLKGVRELTGIYEVSDMDGKSQNPEQYNSAPQEDTP